MSEISLGIALIDYCHKIYSGLTKTKSKKKIDSIILKMVDIQRYGTEQLFEGFLQECIKKEIRRWKKPVEENKFGWDKEFKVEKRRDIIAAVVKNSMELQELIETNVKSHNVLDRNKFIQIFLEYYSNELNEYISQPYEIKEKYGTRLGTKKLEKYIFGDAIIKGNNGKR